MRARRRADDERQRATPSTACAQNCRKAVDDIVDHDVR